MKISKLFHWLYAIVMLLPVFIFIPNAFYYGFNEQATAQIRVDQVPIYYETNDVNSIDDLIVGNSYRLSINYNEPISSTAYIMCFDLLSVNYQYRLTNNPVSYSVPYIIKTSSSMGIRFSDNPNIENTYTCENNGFVDFVYKEGIGLNYIIDYIHICPVNYFKEYQPVEYSMSITDSMATAWNQVWTNDIFSWSYDSFLAEPFKYIGNVFGLPVDNPMYYCLSYWLDISIIWLVFDLIMYIPLLVHRWLDKGIIE